jgi:hypothetical protein
LTRSAADGEDTQQPQPPAEVLAQWLLAREAGARQRSEDLAAAGELAYLRLRTHLAVLLGAAGFDALWARAIHMAQPALGPEDALAAADAAPVDAYGLRAATHRRDLATVQQTLLTVFARFITLLFTFIGEDLGTRFIRQLWPSLPPDAIDSYVEEAAHD